ncbi:MAG: hypothetical protein SAJ12_05660 [Jaaginema sp. PMC 1079.18]|nr:hypothetical protein [Jaaginema sp. PMC 1080.18]MEC4850477.1 hypothetical protein [Jaaginema sp. PMC 1079.18]MEC4867541.1 hypothetical protein [Jaaginema sp. PMC 1078.18]
MNNNCPCCNHTMVLCAGNRRLYWYCLECRQEMPDLVNVMLTTRQHKAKMSSQCPPIQSNLHSEQLAGV